MAKKEALGKGLGALLNQSNSPSTTRSNFQSKPSESAPPEFVGNMAGSIALIPIPNIEANPDQPRREFDEISLQALAKSISELGIIQPITVHKIRANRYQIISGERRFRASQLAGLESVPAYIREADDQTLLEMALVENIQREDLHAIEVAISLDRLIRECNLTHDQLGARIGKERSTISNYIRLLNLPGDMQIAVSTKQISMGHARALVAIADAKWQKVVFDRILDQGLSVRKAEALAAAGPGGTTQRPSPRVVMSFDEQNVLAELKDKFGRNAELKSKGNGAGKIELTYRNAGELEEILKSMNL